MASLCRKTILLVITVLKLFLFNVKYLFLFVEIFVFFLPKLWTISNEICLILC